MFCDDGATCSSYHEVYDRNCGGNIYLDSGSDGSSPTIARFDHLTNVGALDVGCKGPGPGVRIDDGNDAPDAYSFINAIFWDNAPGLDFVANCDTRCGRIRINVSYSMVQTKYRQQRPEVTFGDGIVAPVDPLFADPANGDFHLKSTAGRWTPTGYVKDSVTSPSIAKGYSGGVDQRRIPSAPASKTNSAPTAIAARRRLSAECAGGGDHPRQLPTSNFPPMKASQGSLASFGEALRSAK